MKNTWQRLIDLIGTETALRLKACFPGQVIRVPKKKIDCTKEFRLHEEYWYYKKSTLMRIFGCTKRHALRLTLLGKRLQEEKKLAKQEQPHQEPVQQESFSQES